MTLLPPAGRALIALGWMVVAASTTIEVVRILTSSYGGEPWWVDYELVAQPTYLLVVAAGWWFLGAVTLTRDSLGAATGGLSVFALVSLIQASSAFVQIVGPHFGLGVTSYQVEKWLALIGPLIAVIGFVVGVTSLRAAVLDLPGVVGDVVPELAQGEPEGPPPVDPAGP